MTQAVAIGWTIYQLSNSALALGFMGLVEFIPMALLMLPVGELCDRHNPRRILATLLDGGPCTHRAGQINI